MTLFICHNCSNIKSPSGEACLLSASEDEKDNIIRGHFTCLKNYKVPVTEEERKESVMVLPDNWDFETDFYIVASDEARMNYKHVLSSPMWETSFGFIRPHSNEETLWKNAEEQIHKFKLNQRHERAREHEARSDVSRLGHYTICTLESDPLNRR